MRENIFHLISAIRSWLIWNLPRQDVIAYQIRQSFKPGEITPEEANEVGYETGMRFTKGKHEFIVATHVERAHIHNHIIFNSTNLKCDRKFRDFWFSGIALQRLSDIICLEHGLSVIPKVKPSERQRRTKYPERVSMSSSMSQVSPIQRPPQSAFGIYSYCNKERDNTG